MIRLEYAPKQLTCAGARVDSQTSVVTRCTRQLLCLKRHNLGLVLVFGRFAICLTLR
jgi:hypothetical protein